MSRRRGLKSPDRSATIPSMMNPFGWVKKLVGGTRSGLTLLSPPVVHDRGPLVRFAVAGGTVAGILVAAAIGMGALAALVFALAAIYFLATQVLGIKVNVDPQALYQTVQRQAASYGAN
jgi:hypothetical protein